MYPLMNPKPIFTCVLVAVIGTCLAAHSARAVETAQAITPPTDNPAETAQETHPPAAEASESHHGAADAAHAGAGKDHPVPSIVATAPFIAILLSIALLPLIPSVEHWWHKNANKLIVSGVLAAVTLLYYSLRGYGIVHEGHAAEPGVPTVTSILQHAVLFEYIPFIVLLFSLYTISGGIQLKGDLLATPKTNTAFLAAGAVMASFVGTTGAAMLLIRPLLQTNQERRHVRHTVIFFIFLVANIGGCLLPIGDPPLFLGYLRGVGFTWTLNLWMEWAFCTAVLLTIYYIWDTRAYKQETPLDHMLDVAHREPLSIRGSLNFVWLLGVVLSVALLVPDREFLGTGFVVPVYMREAAQLAFVGLAWITSSTQVRTENKFSFFAIIEVAVLFIGIFICMQVPIEILRARGPELGLHSPLHFFWATGALSSFLDNAPTYVVFFETAKSLPVAEGVTLIAGVPEHLLIAVSLGAVYMGAMTYIGNGPNFMVKSIAEHANVKMPSFFGYMVYSCGILLPVFALVNFVFLYLLD